MKGFLVNINNDRVIAAVERGTVVIVMDTENISITGRNYTSGSSLNWCKRRLNEGDKVKIVVSQIEKSSAPLFMESLPQEELLAEYYQLKKLLTKEGYLK